jgi:hypothetical protein
MANFFLAHHALANAMVEGQKGAVEIIAPRNVGLIA